MHACTHARTHARMHARMHTCTHTHNRFTALWILSRTNRVSRYLKKHSPTHTYRGHQSSLIYASSIYYDPRHPPCSIYVLDSLFPQSLFKFSLVYLLAWHPPLHTPYISSPNDCLLFAEHAHTIATCFAVVSRLCHPILCLQCLCLQCLCLQCFDAVGWASGRASGL